MTAKSQHNYLINNSLLISLENPEFDNQRTGVSTFAIRTSQCTKAGGLAIWWVVVGSFGILLPLCFSPGWSFF